VRNQLYTIPGGGHGDFTLDQEMKAFDAIERFLGDLGIKAMAR